MGLPREVEAVGRAAARRAGIDEPDGISYAAQAWAAHPNAWRTVAWHWCVDERRRVSGRTGPDRRPLVVYDELQPAIGCDDRELHRAEVRRDLATAIGDLPDEDLATLARRYWLDLPAGPRNSPQARAEARAMRHARAQAVAETIHTPPGAPPAAESPTVEGCPLTTREKDVLTAAADGLTTDLVADRLCLSPNTIKTHLARISRRIRARNTTHAVAIALRAGWIS